MTTLIVIVAVLIVLAIAAYMFRKRQAAQVEERREEAQGTREEARASERRAEQARLEAEEQAERARREQAAAEDLQRKADEVDPDVDVDASDEERKTNGRRFAGRRSRHLRRPRTAATTSASAGSGRPRRRARSGDAGPVDVPGEAEVVHDAGHVDPPVVGAEAAREHDRPEPGEVELLGAARRTARARVEPPVSRARGEPVDAADHLAVALVPPR